MPSGAGPMTIRQIHRRDAEPLRSKLKVPANLFVMVEATDAAHAPFMRGIYRLAYVRTKTGFSP